MECQSSAFQGPLSLGSGLGLRDCCKVWFGERGRNLELRWDLITQKRCKPDIIGDCAHMNDEKW